MRKRPPNILETVIDILSSREGCWVVIFLLILAAVGIGMLVYAGLNGVTS
jgi:hypothetical protein